MRIYDWEQIHSMVLGMGYQLIDLHEHEFKKADLHVEYGTIDSLYEFAGVREEDIEIVEINQIRFRVPNIEQFLKIYRASSKDSYRNENNNDKDFAKISWLESKRTRP